MSYYIIDIYLVKLISEIEVLRENAADLLAVKVEKLLGFRYLTQSNQQKKFADEKQKEVTELQKWGKSSARSVKEVLFVCKFNCMVIA